MSTYIAPDVMGTGIEARVKSAGTTFFTVIPTLKVSCSTKVTCPHSAGFEKICAVWSVKHTAIPAFNLTYTYTTGYDGATDWHSIKHSTSHADRTHGITSGVTDDAFEVRCNRGNCSSNSIHLP